MAVAAMLFALVVSMAVVYTVTRLRFAFFHCLIRHTKEIRPGWHIYREPATRFFWLNVAVGFCFLLLVVLVALPFATGFWRLFREIPPGGHPYIGLLLSLVLPLIPLILLLVVTGIVTDVILRDWMLPHFALDNATAGEAWTSVWASINAEKKQFFVYVLLRVVMPTVAMAVLFMVLIVPGLALALNWGDRVRCALSLCRLNRRRRGCRSNSPGVLRRGCTRPFVVGQRLPWRARGRGDTGACADVLRRPLPGPWRHPLPAGSATAASNRYTVVCLTVATFAAE